MHSRDGKQETYDGRWADAVLEVRGKRKKKKKKKKKEKKKKNRGHILEDSTVSQAGCRGEAHLDGRPPCVGRCNCLRPWCALISCRTASSESHSLAWNRIRSGGHDRRGKDYAAALLARGVDEKGERVVA